MEPGKPIGLVKFFRNEDYLDSLLSGRFYCATPETYRLATQEGVSDKQESCAFSYRAQRNDPSISINFGHHNLSDAIAATIQNRSEKDAWMHCWFSLSLPEDQHALDRLKSDVYRMKHEFGNNYAFVPFANIQRLAEKLSQFSHKPMACGLVKYSSEPSNWGTLCKSLEYAYQREYRFLFGECSTNETAPYSLDYPERLDSLILKNEPLKIQNMDTFDTYFYLST